MGRDRLLTNCIRCWEVVNSKILSILKKASNECSWNTSAWTATSNFKICYWILLFNKRNFMSLSAKKNETQYRMVSAEYFLILHFSSQNCSQPTNKWIFVNQFFCKKGNLRQQPCASKNNNFSRKTWRVHKYPQEKIIHF